MPAAQARPSGSRPQLKCPDANNITKTGSPVSITTGDVGSDIPMVNATGSKTCTLSLTVADALGGTTTEATNLVVRASRGCCSSSRGILSGWKQEAACVLWHCAT